MARNEDREQLRLLDCGDDLELSKFKERIKLEQAGKEVVSRPDAQASGEFFDNRIGVITVEELAVIFGLAPQTIRNWIALGKIPHVKVGRRYFLQRRSVQEWLNQKEVPQWR